MSPMSSILLTRTNLNRLRALYPDHDRTYIWRALNFKTNNRAARAIRYLAMSEFGGILT